MENAKEFTELCKELRIDGIGITRELQRFFVQGVKRQGSHEAQALSQIFDLDTIQIDYEGYTKEDYLYQLEINKKLRETMNDNNEDAEIKIQELEKQNKYYLHLIKQLDKKNPPDTWDFNEFIYKQSDKDNE